MKLEAQCVSLELAKKLKELGVKQESLFYWATWWEQGYRILTKESLIQNGSRTDALAVYAAFTVAEMGEMLPIYNQSWKDIKIGWLSGFNAGRKAGTDVLTTSSKTEADARAKMLIHLISQGLVKP